MNLLDYQKYKYEVPIFEEFLQIINQGSNAFFYLISSTNVFIFSSLMNALSNVWALLLYSSENIASLVVKTLLKKEKLKLLRGHHKKFL